MKKLLILLVSLVSVSAQAQLDPLYNQYTMNQSMVNPAYIGIYPMGHISAITRGQWVGVDGAPFTHTLSFYNSISNHSSVGVTAISDGFGINNNLDAILAYAYQMDVGAGGKLSFGLQGIFSSYKQDFNKLDLDVNDDPAIGQGVNQFSNTNFGFGLMYSNESFYLGAASPRMQEFQIDQDGAIIATYEASYNLSSGFIVRPTDALQIKPSILARYQGDELAVDLNGQVLLNEQIWLGVSTRNFSTGGVSFIYRHQYIYHFGYAFEFPFGDIGKGNYGIHELMFSVDLRLSKDHETPDRFF